MPGSVVARRDPARMYAAQNVAALGQAEDSLRGGLGKLFAVAEAYPELRANESFMQLQARITQLENAIAD